MKRLILCAAVCVALGCAKADAQCCGGNAVVATAQPQCYEGNAVVAVVQAQPVRSRLRAVRVQRATRVLNTNRHGAVRLKLHLRSNCS